MEENCSTKLCWFLSYNNADQPCAALCLVAQLYPTLCDPMDCSPPGSSVHGDTPGKNTWGGRRALLQGSFPTQGSNPGLLHCSWILYCPQTVTREAQEYWSGQPIPPPGDLPDPGIKPGSPALQADSLSAELPGKPQISCNYTHITSLLILPLLPTPRPFRQPQSARRDSPFYAAASRRLSVLHLIVYMCRCYLLRLSHCVSKSVLYICVSIPSLQTGSPIPLC